MMEIFTSGEKDTSLKEFLEYLSPEDIEGLTYSRIIDRGKGYYQQGNVKAASVRDRSVECEIENEVGVRYTVRFEKSGSTVSADCTCPFEGVCKHIIASLLFIIHKGISRRQETAEGRDQQIRDYLLSRPKEELVALVMEHASDSFLQDLRLKFASNSEIMKLVSSIRKKISRLFTSDIVYDPDGFEEELMRNLELLRGAWNKDPDEIFAILLQVLNDIDEAYEDGKLYDDYSDHNLDEGRLNTYIADFLRSMDSGRKLRFLRQVLDFSSGSGYSFLDPLLREVGSIIVTDREKEDFKSDLFALEDYDAKLIESLYETYRDFLTGSEMQRFFEKFARVSSKMTLAASRYYAACDEEAKAKSALESYLDKPYPWDTFEVYEERLRLAFATTGDDPRSWAEKLLRAHPTEKALSLIASLVPENELPDFEKLLYQLSNLAYVHYLENAGRLVEVVDIFNRKEMKEPKEAESGAVYGPRFGNTITLHDKYEFFKRHKSRFPQDAARVFLAYIQAESNYTGDTHYYEVAEALAQLQAVDQEESRRQLLSIRQFYKRRRNLMQILSERFGNA
ncbi:MAG: SWIM zinc finger family protein [bacterium]